jgi:hypothetical protein
MRLERWPSLREDTWPFLRKVSSAISGKEVEVIPGGYPAVTQVYPKDYMSRISIPTAFTLPGKEKLLNGSLAHELLHIFATDPEATSGIQFGVFIMANALEDARLEVQLEAQWPGLIAPVKRLTRELLAFRRRSRAMAQSTETAKLYEVGLSLYLRLVNTPPSIVCETISSMADAVAVEVLPIAHRALIATNTGEVVVIADEICKELAKAAEAVAKRLGTSSASSWASSFKTELKRAQARTVEEVLLNLERRRYPGVWFGPWMRGGGGYNFYSTAWKWEEDKLDNYKALSLPEIRRALMDADPLLEEWIIHPRESTGRLTISSSALVEAVIGRGPRRVFERVEHSQRMLLLNMLGSIDVFVFLEAHPRYDRSEWLFLKALAASLGRLFNMVQTPLFVMRGSTTTRTKEMVENPITKRKYERWSKDHYVEVVTFKAPDTVWDEKSETLLASMPQKGFNQPLEAYSRMKSWSLKIPKNERLRFYIVIGKAKYLNVYSGHLQYATESIRGHRQKAIYIHVGRPIPSYDQRLEEYNSCFDAFVQASTTLRETIIQMLYRIVIEMAKQGSAQ